MAKAPKKFVIVTSKYFSKWVEVEVVMTITHKSVERFLWEHVIYRLGLKVPYKIIVDNGPQLREDRISQFYNILHINLSSTFYITPLNERLDWNDK